MSNEHSVGMGQEPASSAQADFAADPFLVTFELAPIGLAHVAPSGAWIRVNAHLSRMLGYTPADLLNLTFQQITYPDDLEADVSEVQRLLAGEITGYHMEKRYVRGDGSVIWANLTVALVRDAAGRPDYFISAVEDISARHRAEQQIADRAALIDLAFDAIFVQDTQTDRITFWSKGAERAYGWTQEEAVGKVASEMLKTKFPTSRGDVLRALQDFGTWEGDLIHTCKDGRQLIMSSRWALQETGGGRDVLEVNRDVTEQRQLETKRAEYAASQERIAETLQRSLLMTPPPDIFPGLTVKAIYQGAEDDVLVGGDFFDIFALSENKIALVVGDATGKGLEAAAYTAEVKFALRAILHEHPAPVTALARLNRLTADKERLDASRLGACYVALAVVVVDTTTGEMEASLAGMEMPFLLRAGGGIVHFTSGGPLLGVSLEAEYVSEQEIIAEGDLLVISTDGLLEARHPDRRRDFFGTDGLARAMREEEQHHSSLAEAGLAVVERTREFAGGAINDDICLLLARRISRG